MYNEKQHTGGVNSRIHESCLVAEPISVVIDGKVTDLSLADTIALRQGLDDAIERVNASEKALKGDRNDYHLPIIAKPGKGMSLPRSKLGDREFLDMFTKASDMACLKNISEGQLQPVLLNSNTKMFLKLDGSSS